jgi:hypothetical protein
MTHAGVVGFDFAGCASAHLRMEKRVLKHTLREEQSDDSFRPFFNAHLVVETSFDCPVDSIGQ